MMQSRQAIQLVLNAGKTKVLIMLENEHENEILKDISMDIDFKKLPPEQQEEVLSFIEFIKNKENNTNK